MEEKEMNKQILNQLYGAAVQILNRLQLEPGAYTANEILKLAKEGKIALGFEGGLDALNIAVDGFTCSLPYCQVFAFIAKFEKLAGVTGDKRHLFVVEPEDDRYLSKVVVRINSTYASLCKCTDMRSTYDNFHYICVEVERNEICATNGKIAQIKSLQVVDSSEYDQSGTRPMIDADTWVKMCKKAGKNGADLVCKLKEVADKYGNKKAVWESVCCGHVSTTNERKGLDYYKVLPKVDVNHKVEMSLSEWKKAKKYIKTVLASFGDENARLIIEHSENDRFLTFTAKDSAFSLSAVAKFECVASPAERWAICFNGSTLTNDLDQFCLYLPDTSESAAIFVNSDNIQLRMPMSLPDDMEGYSWSNNTYTANVFDIVDLHDVAFIEPRKNHRVCTAKKLATLKAENQEDKKACEVVEISAKSAKVEDKKPTKVGRSFSFDKIGLSVGTIIQFIDGTDVTVAENNMIEFCGELFTLSGFTRTFIPEDKANNSGAYRGCAFFFYQGTRLDKLLRAALSSQEEECAKVEKEIAKIEQEISQVEEVGTIPAFPGFVEESCIETEREAKQIAAVIIHLLPCIISGTFIYPDTPYFGGGVPIVGCRDVWYIDTRLLPGRSKVVHELPLPPPGFKTVKALL